ncbi:WAP four-disulfide core domain protein 6A-like [Mesocricetus auratus]|uniref:WAP four-disulfide core domain protein 6A-like n=1 Tax=Mesocricetus auratus TaxID=10036 RepID=A0ABM2WL29_MESAU|nr:WAP four-disulfide core domain protein 6A-like [Mesocricetus auratus]
MRLWGLLPFLGPFIFLWGIWEPELAEGFFVRSCPRDRVKCGLEERSQCTRVRQCPDNKRCCMFACGKKCVDPNEDVCSLPQVAGPCLASFRRWWYNKETKTCTEFIYGGCQGNLNNFQSKDVCIAICKKKPLSSWLQG